MPACSAASDWINSSTWRATSPPSTSQPEELELRETSQEKAGHDEQKRFVLEAHEALVEADAANEVKFKDVLDYMRHELNVSDSRKDSRITRVLPMRPYVDIYLPCAVFRHLHGSLVVLNTFTRRISELERQRADLQVEEDRVFDFLHGLGEAFSEGVSSTELHRLIVESAIRILNAHGGALYLMDKTEPILVPAFISKGCPALIKVPVISWTRRSGNHLALESYLRLSSVRRGEGIVGAAAGGRSVAPLFRGRSCLCPLARAISWRILQLSDLWPIVVKLLGVLGLANGPMSTPFSEKDLTVFKTIAEQSAFALYNEVIYLEAGEKKRLDHDLEIAREIQAILLPSRPPAIAGYELSGINVPARQVSGDYYDYIQVDERRVGVAIADVSGKGVPASLIMAMCRSVIRSEAVGKVSAAEVLRRVNQQLYPDIKEDMFISMAYLITRFRQATT